MCCLYVFENWFLSFRNGRRLRFVENRALRKTFVPKRKELTGDWRKFRNEKLYYW